MEPTQLERQLEYKLKGLEMPLGERLHASDIVNAAEIDDIFNPMPAQLQDPSEGTAGLEDCAEEPGDLDGTDPSDAIIDESLLWLPSFYQYSLHEGYLPLFYRHSTLRYGFGVEYARDPDAESVTVCYNADFMDIAECRDYYCEGTNRNLLFLFYVGRQGDIEIFLPGLELGDLEEYASDIGLGNEKDRGAYRTWCEQTEAEVDVSSLTVDGVVTRVYEFLKERLKTLSD